MLYYQAGEFTLFVSPTMILAIGLHEHGFFIQIFLKSVICHFRPCLA